MNESNCLNNEILNLMQKRVSKNRRPKQERESLGQILGLSL